MKEERTKSVYYIALVSSSGEETCFLKIQENDHRAWPSDFEQATSFDEGRLTRVNDISEELRLQCRQSEWRVVICQVESIIKYGSLASVKTYYSGNSIPEESFKFVENHSHRPSRSNVNDDIGSMLFVLAIGIFIGLAIGSNLQ